MQEIQGQIDEIKARLAMLEHQQQVKVVVEHQQKDTERFDHIDEIGKRHEDSLHVLQADMAGAKADILQIKESQADMRDKLISLAQDQAAHFEVMVKTVEDSSNDVRNDIRKLEQRMDQRFDQILALLTKKEQ
jgi:hypothetical protein